MELLANLNILGSADLFSRLIDFLGVFTIVVGILAASTTFFIKWMGQNNFDAAYTEYRKNLGRVILLSLNFLIAGDIIGSVVGEPTLTSVGVLVIIVLIRSFLSITFEMEVLGRWPWQRFHKPANP